MIVFMFRSMENAAFRLYVRELADEWVEYFKSKSHSLANGAFLPGKIQVEPKSWN